jgi:hypothetical protein
MLRNTKHIILVGSSSPHLISLQDRIREITPGAQIHITDISCIGKTLQQQKADMILIYTNGDTKGFPYVQQIRQEALADGIPVFVCGEPLDEAVLKALVNGNS